MDKVKAFVKDVQAGDSRPARLTLKALSIFTGLFLIIAGIFGMSEFFESLIYFVGSLYSIVFGLLVLVIEAKDKVPKFKLAYEWIDVSLKFLTVQRGKGMFYCGVGLLVFFIGYDGAKWGLNNVAALFLFTVGGIHTFKLIKEALPAQTEGMSAVQAGEGPALTQWEEMRVQAAARDDGGLNL